jgi:signal transduction histidine kinase
VRQYLRFIGQECRRLSAVIENVLDFSRRGQGREHFDFEATDIAALVDETVSLMRMYGAERGVRLATVTHGVPQPVVADGRAIQRLLVNLIDNAQKHAPEGSEVTVGLEFSDALVSLWVEDRGPGIPRHEQARIFERFYRVGSELQRQTQGVGLGLSIVKHLAEVHGGRVRVRSEVGQGSRFTVELPLNAVSRMSPESMPA